MEDYASARLVTLVRQALATEGVHADAPVTSGALLPLAAKRRFLADVARAHGPLPLLRAGLWCRTAPAFRSDPAVTALLGAATPHELFERWGRLERFTHSRHRVEPRESGPGHLVVEHTGPPGDPPGPAEDAVVLGLLTGLLTMTGAQGVTVAAGRPPRPVFAADAFTAAPPPDDSARWTFTWSGTAPPPPRARETDAGPVARARRLLATDPARRWTLGALAGEFGVSTRGLQRLLAGAGGFSGLLGETRARAAAALLVRDGHPLDVIGFACGYADQPHFTRQFKHRTAMTPAAYRTAFGRPADTTVPLGGV
ncbi:helix-turn-helix domain-containing protein [Streptomyces sp. JNUCC 64]